MTDLSIATQPRFAPAEVETPAEYDAERERRIEQWAAHYRRMLGGRVSQGGYKHPAANARRRPCKIRGTVYLSIIDGARAERIGQKTAREWCNAGMNDSGWVQKNNETTGHDGEVPNA